jgi:hypothetical protein
MEGTMALHIVPGTSDGDRETLKKAAGDRSDAAWVVPKKA